MDWAVSVTHKYGDAAAQARQAIEDGVDLVAGYGGDGTQHEIANALVEASVATGRQTPMGILPGGTGNGFAREMGIPKTLREATEVLCTSTRTRAVDVGRLQRHRPGGGRRPLLRPAHVRRRRARGADEPRAQGQVRRVRVPRQRHPARGRDEVVGYRVGLDGDPVEFEASKVYVVNSGMMGTGLRITHSYAVDDGLFDCFLVDKRDLSTLTAAAVRFLNLPRRRSAATTGRPPG